VSIGRAVRITLRARPRHTNAARGEAALACELQSIGMTPGELIGTGSSHEAAGLPPAAAHLTGGFMAAQKELPRPAAHLCPVCRFPQTKIQRILGEGKYGSISHVCSRAECSIGLDLSKIETWAAV